MRAITIHDMRVTDSGHKLLAFDLIDILRAIERSVANSKWQVTNVWCISRGGGEQEPEFSQLLEFRELVEFAMSCSQVIDGEFRAYRSNSENTWLALVADDSTYYAVVTDDDDVLSILQRRFSDVRNSDQWASSFVM